MQAAFLNMAGADYARQQQRSAYLAPSTDRAVRAQNRWDNEMNQWSARWQGVKNDYLTSPFVDVMASISKSIRDFFGMKDISKKIPPDLLTKAVREIAGSNFGGRKLKGLPPKRWKGDF